MGNGNTAEKGIMGEGQGEVLRCERKLFRDCDKGLKVGETDKLVIFVIASSLTHKLC